MRADRQEQVDFRSLAKQNSAKIELNQSNTNRLVGSQLFSILKIFLNEALDHEVLAIVDSLEDDGHPGLYALGRESQEQTTHGASQKKLPLDELEEKPLIWIVKMQFVSEGGKEAVTEEGGNGYYWATVVSLPERYHFYDNTFTHQAQRLFFIDPCNVDQKLSSQQLLRFFDPLDLGRTKMETHLMQQASYFDSGWWALYHGLMIVSRHTWSACSHMGMVWFLSTAKHFRSEFTNI